MRAMVTEPSAESSQFRVALFVGPQPVEGKPYIQSTVFNVKKRSWKGGVQVAVEIAQAQIDAISSATGFPQWLTEALVAIPTEELPSYQTRAQELLIQAISRCKLDLMLQSGITQENQSLAADTFVAELSEVVGARREFLASHVATELDLQPHDSTLSP
jgi:hypothetical protein